MKTEFGQSLTVATLVHAAFVGGLLLATALPGLRHNRGLIPPIEVVFQPSMMPAGPAGGGSRGQSHPVAAPIDTGPAQGNKSNPPQAVKSTPPRAVRSTSKPRPAGTKQPSGVRKPDARTVKPAAGRQKPAPVSSGSIEQMLLDGLPARRTGAAGSRGVTISGHDASFGAGPGGGRYDPEAIYWAAVRQVFHDAWDQPNDADAGDAAARVRIRLTADGLVSNPVLSESSGNETMDESALQAVQSVGYIPGLTADFVARHSSITIEFKVEDQEGVP